MVLFPSRSMREAPSCLKKIICVFQPGCDSPQQKYRHFNFSRYVFTCLSIPLLDSPAQHSTHMILLGVVQRRVGVFSQCRSMYPSALNAFHNATISFIQSRLPFNALILVLSSSTSLSLSSLSSSSFLLSSFSSSLCSSFLCWQIKCNSGYSLELLGSSSRCRQQFGLLLTCCLWSCGVVVCAEMQTRGYIPLYTS
ncbi:uncharacterized protein FMAN_12864 [Fusarium mangiferae]|uniref:Uncharacterized protein n=1 Tax=Fusarium mangiferae TaxID=192010 RepID=A0A1L7UCF7_FUSMA|nr:uncharacterized protein FMAN_12864 [Fusarium mangiferae]CVL04786.1 uncharacterized protein FMAN_12864 [Fusarium mangiferae]